MRYIVKFKLANDEAANSVDLKNYTNALEQAIMEYNQAGARARNKKHIYHKQIFSSVIVLEFESEEELENPTKSFRYFSKNLIDNSPDFRSWITSEGRLLKGIYAGEVREDLDLVREDLEISDEKMINTLIHWCMTKEMVDIDEKKDRRKIINKIKELLKEQEISWQ